MNIEGKQFFDSKQVKDGTEGDFVIPAEMIKIDRPVTTEEKNIALLEMKKREILNQIELLRKEFEVINQEISSENKKVEQQAQQN